MKINENFTNRRQKIAPRFTERTVYPPNFAPSRTRRALRETRRRPRVDRTRARRANSASVRRRFGRSKPRNITALRRGRLPNRGIDDDRFARFGAEYFSDAFVQPTASRRLRVEIADAATYATYATRCTLTFYQPTDYAFSRNAATRSSPSTPRQTLMFLINLRV